MKIFTYELAMSLVSKMPHNMGRICLLRLGLGLRLWLVFGCMSPFNMQREAVSVCVSVSVSIHAVKK